MRILIVDSNIVYAKRIRTALECYVHDVIIDLANDVFVTRRRLKHNQYNLIIADIQTMANQDMLADELKQSNTPTIAWTILSQRDNLQKMLLELGQNIRTINKPYNDSEVEEAASIAMTTASGINKFNETDFNSNR